MALLSSCDDRFVVLPPLLLMRPRRCPSIHALPEKTRAYHLRVPTNVCLPHDLLLSSSLVVRITELSHDATSLSCTRMKNHISLSIKDACKGGTTVESVQEYCNEGYEGPGEPPIASGARCLCLMN